jgi:hypothetical protein
MLKGSTFERAARQIHKVDFSLLELDTEVLTIVWCLASWLELDRVDLNANDETGIRYAPVNFLYDLEDDAAAVV